MTKRVILILPNRRSLIRLFGALLIEFDEKWASGRQYLEMTQFDLWLKDRSKDVNNDTAAAC